MAIDGFPPIFKKESHPGIIAHLLCLAETECEQNDEHFIEAQHENPPLGVPGIGRDRLQVRHSINLVKSLQASRARLSTFGTLTGFSC
jgi:hypothetical protein